MKTNWAVVAATVSGIAVSVAGCAAVGGEGAASGALTRSPQPCVVEVAPTGFLAPTPAAYANTGRTTYLDFDDPLPHFNAYYTWSNWGPGDDTERAIFYWNGRCVGGGRAAVARITLLIAELPAGSAILSFPRVDPRDGRGLEAEPDNVGVSLPNWVHLRGDTLIRSWRDQNGRVVDSAALRKLRRQGRVPPDFGPETPVRPATRSW